MANAFYGDSWQLDTADNVLLIQDYAYIKYIDWVGDQVVGAGGAPHAVIEDGNNHIVWEAYANASTFDIHQSIERHWFDGFKVTVLDGGIVHVYYK